MTPEAAASKPREFCWRGSGVIANLGVPAYRRPVPRRSANCSRWPIARDDPSSSRSPSTTRLVSGSMRTTNFRSPSATPNPFRWPTVKPSTPSCRPTTSPAVVTNSPGVEFACAAASDELVVATARDEANFLAVLLVGDVHAHLCRQFANRWLVVAAHRQQHSRKVLSLDAEQHVRLIFSTIDATDQCHFAMAISSCA